MGLLTLVLKEKETVVTPRGQMHACMLRAKLTHHSWAEVEAIIRLEQNVGEAWRTQQRLLQSFVPLEGLW